MDPPSRFAGQAVEKQLVTLILAAFPLGSPVQAPDPFAPEQWAQLDAYAVTHGLTGLLFAAVTALGRPDMPPALAADLKDRARQTTLAQALAYRDLGKLLRRARTENLPVIVLKGAALAKTLYAESLRRSFGDLDLLIQEQDATRLRAAVLQEQYRETHALSPGFRESYYGEMGFHREGKAGLELDVHWGLAEAVYFRRRMDMQWFWDRTETATLGQEPMRILNPTAQLVHLGAHAGLNHQDKPRLVWFYDLALLITRRGREIDWDEADRYVRHAGLARPLRYALAETERRWGIPLPAQPLFVPPRLDPAGRMVYALTTTSFTEARTLSDVLATPGLRPKLRFARQQLFPDAAYMRTRYNIANPALLPLYYALRLGESGFKFARSVGAAAARVGRLYS